jgi:hypothetical protein
MSFEETKKAFEREGKAYEWIKDVTKVDLVAISLVDIGPTLAFAHTFLNPLTHRDHWTFMFHGVQSETSKEFSFLTAPIAADLFSTCGLLDGLSPSYCRMDGEHEVAAAKVLRMLVWKQNKMIELTNVLVEDPVAVEEETQTTVCEVVVGGDDGDVDDDDEGPTASKVRALDLSLP